MLWAFCKPSIPCSIIWYFSEFFFSGGRFVKAAERKNRYILAGIDYVGGLEFDGVIITGVDKNRVPPSFAETNYESYHFLNYAWHNRMYVAVTRAKYSVILLGEKSCGTCQLFNNAIENEMVKFG